MELKQIKEKLEEIVKRAEYQIAQPSYHHSSVVILENANKSLILIAKMEKEETHPPCPFCGQRHKIYIPGPGCEKGESK